MKRFFLLAVLSLCALQLAIADNMRVTIVAGTPVQLSATRLLVNSIMIQLRSGSTGKAYIMTQIPSGTTPAASNGAHLSAELTSVGATYSDDVGGLPGKIIDLSQVWIDGSVSADTVTITYSRR